MSPHHRVASLTNWREPGSWNSFAHPYPFTSTLKLTSHIPGSLRIACVLDEGIRKMATIKTGQSFSFEFTERSPERNNMMCFLWQRCAINKLVGFTYCIMALVPARTLHLIFGPRTEIFVRGKFIQIMLWVLSEPIINLNIFRMHQLGINGGSSSIRVESHHKFIICLFHINIIFYVQ